MTRGAWAWVGAFVATVAATTASAPSRTALAEEAKPAFVGADECKKCHLKQHKSWKATPMSKSFEALKPNAAAERKTKHGIDVAKDFTKDPKCLKCHTTGYGTESGYPAVVEGKELTPEEQTRAARLQGVTCEACHGPGSLYGPFKKSNEKFKLEEVQKLGATSPPKAEQCMVCHVKECPAMPADYAFDFEKAKGSKDIHEHVPLKHPH
jgi:hypothetical protein